MWPSHPKQKKQALLEDDLSQLHVQAASKGARITAGVAQ